MTGVALHAVPRWRSVAGEQTRFVGMRSRAFCILLLSVAILMAGGVIWNAMKFREAVLNKLQTTPLIVISYSPELSGVAILIAMLYAFVVWQDEDPSRRHYHWMMPMSRQAHAYTRVFAGWLWLLALTAIFIVYFTALGKIVARVAEQPPLNLAWWAYLVPFTAVTIAYLIASALVVGTRRPAIWMAGMFVVVPSVPMGLQWIGFDRAGYKLGKALMMGRYSVVPALTGQVEWYDPVTHLTLPSAARWLISAAIWIAASAGFLAWLSRRYADAK
jgi:hypothetical protein